MVRSLPTYCEMLPDPLIVKIHCGGQPSYSGDKRAINGQPLGEAMIDTCLMKRIRASIGTLKNIHRIFEIR